MQPANQEKAIRWTILLIRLLHLSCVFLLILGWMLPKAYLLYHLLAVPGVILHWWQNNGECVLTQIEGRLRGGSENESVQGEFTQRLLTLVGLKLRPRQMIVVIYGVLALSWFMSLYKLLNDKL